MNDIKLFENESFGQISVLESDEHGFLFVGHEIATMAGYKAPRDAIRNLADKYKVKLNYNELNELFSESKILDSKINPNGLVMINEPGLYKLSSGKNEEFENWIFFEVLPSIRKTGSYCLDSVVEQQLETTFQGVKILTGVNPEEIARVQNESWRAKLANLINDIAKREQISTKSLYEKLYFLFASETGFHIPELAKEAKVTNSYYLKQHELSAKMLYEFALAFFYKDKRFVELININPNQRTLGDFKGGSKC
jgi:prophage antirepressor-like protein